MAHENYDFSPESHDSIPRPNRFGLIIHPTVFIGASIVILIFITLGVVIPDTMETVFEATQAFIAHYFGWFYMIVVTGILVFIIWVAFSRYGNIPLGPNDSKPDYSYFAWFTMLFAAGMGIGLLFYSVAEPLTHFTDPPTGAGRLDGEGAQRAFHLTYFHWGVHPWAIYSLFGATVAYVGFRRGQPLTYRTAFYPLLGERVHGAYGSVLDIFGTVGTLFGVATSLGLAAIQINRGLEYAFGVGIHPYVQFALIAIITALATTSEYLGLDAGIRRVSMANISLAGIACVVMLIIGPTVFIFNIFVQNLGYYVQHLIETTTWTATFEGSEWLADWSVFYWAWWISWSPFVGLFIARISRGRTLREFIVGTILAPTLATFAWMSIFGGSAMFIEMFQAPDAGLAAEVAENVDVAMFALLEHFPFHQVTWIFTLVLILGFFVSSSDSGSMVDSIITAGGHPHPPRPQRIYWCVMEGVVAAILLWVGGLTALQTGAITTGLPLAALLVLMAVSLHKALRQERSIRFSPVFQPPEIYEELTGLSDTESEDEEDDIPHL
ncbi:MAG: BCCT family transporter [Candidatus Hydrogenedentota bacterium]